MERYTKSFIASALIYAIIGSFLGILYLLTSEGFISINGVSIYPLIVATVHAFLLGFFTMMIFGVTYHIIPMFTEKGFYSPVLAYTHLFLSNLGVIGIITFLLFSTYYPTESHPMAKGAAVLEAASLIVFIFNMLLTFIKGIPGTGPPNPFGTTDKETDLVATRYTSASIIYFLIGCVLGAWMFLSPGDIYFIMPVHAHINLVGFVSMMIFGVSYHMFPRFAGRPLHSIPIARRQFTVLNVGLIGMVLLFAFAERDGAIYRVILPLFGTATSVSIGLYVYNVWKTLGANHPST
ncbi:MAG: cbb3-type cytochrome c oxidase subunit I [Deltaproteobacteria bacterium]